jgi:uncharacterized membrane protein YagU involved in acid resistance
MNTGRAAAAGLIGTGVMTALLLVEPSVGLPKIAMGQVLSTALGLASAHLATGAALGWVLHFVMGILLALLYAGVFDRRLPGPPLLRGLVYGGLVFAAAQLIFMPLVGGGVFSHGDLELLTGSLIGHLVFGGLVGWIYAGPVSDAEPPSGAYVRVSTPPSSY